MDEQWQAKEAAKAGRVKVEQAHALLEEAEAIFSATERKVDADNVREAMQYTGEVIG